MMKKGNKKKAGGAGNEPEAEKMKSSSSHEKGGSKAGESGEWTTLARNTFPDMKDISALMNSKELMDLIMDSIPIQIACVDRNLQ